MKSKAQRENPVLTTFTVMDSRAYSYYSQMIFLYYAKENLA